jgi:hypothetical protein
VGRPRSFGVWWCRRRRAARVVGGITEVDSIGIGNNTWSDHTDMRPTILGLAGLNHDHVHDGRAISEIPQGYAVPRLWRKARACLSRANVQAAERAIRGFCHGHAHVFQQGAGFEGHERRHLQLVGCEQSWNSRQRKGWATQGRRVAFLLMQVVEAVCLGNRTRILFFALRSPRSKFLTGTWKPTAEAHQAALRAASAPTGFPYVDRFRW